MIRRLSLFLAALSLVLPWAETARAQVTLAAETAKEFRIQGAEIVQFEPLVVRTGANTGGSLWTDGKEWGTYLGAEDVRVAVYGAPGVANLAEVPNFGVDHGSPTTEITFYGAADAWVEDLELVVQMGDVTEVVVEAGAEVLPIEESDLAGALALGWYYEEIPWVMKEFRIAGAEVVQADPLVVRIGANKDVSLCLDDAACQSYLGDGDVRMVVVGRPGKAVLPELPRMKVDYGATTTEIVFVGAAETWVDGRDLVIRMAGVQDVVLEAGADVLPVTAEDLTGVSELTWACEKVQGSNPHQPV